MTETSLLLQETQAGLPSPLREQYFHDECFRGVHLAIMREPYMGFVLDGSKTIESRFSLNRVDPFERVAVGDLVLLKSGAVSGAFIVGDVDFRTLLPGDVNALKVSMNDQIRGEDEFWERKADARFATLITVEDAQLVTPFEVSKRDMRGWVVLRPAVRELVPMW